ncbi:MAG: amidohydrolase family protein [Paracoccaceae bacterium]|nr:amidohydrolase family protein [Paracoccaceae bacterium]
MRKNPISTKLAHKVIAVEEHFMHSSLTKHFGGGGHRSEKIQSRLYDYVGVRIEEMDAAGIDMQVLSHQSPGSQRLSNDIALQACRSVNDALASIIAQAPDRFSGFAMIPTMLPDAAADELQRSVEELGLKGAMIHGLSQGEMVDGEKYWPIFARAENLGVPIYLHPADPDKLVSERYYAPYDKSHPMVTRAAWGFGLEAGTQAVRLILSGVFDKHPNLKILLGHFGEAIPFWMPRIHESLSRPGGAQVNFTGIFKQNFWITTSGFFSDTALRCCLEVVNPDRILFAVDWPYADNTKGVVWLKNCSLEDNTKADIFARNAETFLKL